MSVACAPLVADLPVANAATPAGVRLLGLVERMRQTGMAVSRCINRIARQRLDGQDMRRMAPSGFNATAAHALVVQSLAWIAALRERLLAVAAIRPAFVPATGSVPAKRAPQGRSAAFYLPDEVPNPTEDDWHDWWDLAKPLRIGPGGVAVAHQQIAGMSNQAVVAGVHSNLSTVLAQLGSEADVQGIAAVAAAADALLPIAEAIADEAANPVAEADVAPADAAPSDEAVIAAARLPLQALAIQAGVALDAVEIVEEHDPVPPQPPDG